MVGLLVASVLGLVLVVAFGYDVRQRRRGVVMRGSSELVNESMHHRVDINAVAYEPARQPGQRDWATYRARDRKHRD
ncbi:MAG: hypothetical protein QOF18_2219 [Frankiaceae bacterium]|nr:hypothetical protein [Frankiaceae bacterium]